MRRLPVTREIGSVLGSGRGRWLALAGVATLVVSAVFHANPWHVAAALIWALTIAWFQGVSRLAEGRLFRLPTRWQRALEGVSVPLAVLGMFATFATVALRSSRLWGVLSLVGALALLWVFLVRLLVFKKQALLSLAEIGTLWALILLVSPHIEYWGTIETTGLLGVFFVLSVYTLLPRFRRVPTQWAPWRGYLYAIVGALHHSFEAAASTVERVA